MIEARLTEFRDRKYALDEQLVKLAVEASAFMATHCPVKVGDVVDWVRADRTTVPLRVSYIEQFGYRWLPAILEKPPLRGYVVQSDGTEEPKERSIYCNWQLRGSTRARVRTRPATFLELDKASEAVLPAVVTTRLRTRTRG